jgi:hypothetical protein
MRMPAFGDTDTLTQAEIADIEAYVMSVNGVSRAKIEHPGLSPRLLVGAVWLAVAGAGLLLAILWLGMRRRVR